MDTPTLAGSTDLGIVAASPGIFTANGAGTGVPSGQFYSASTAPIPLAQSSGSANPLPIDPSVDQAIVLYGTGFRGASPSDLSATIGGIPMQIAFVGKQSQYVGLDQLNLTIPAALAASPPRSVPLAVSYDGTPFATLSVLVTAPASGQ